ncbi:MAG TPA: CoA transferase [Caulobacteraceae bacterium]|nr:CoA transferase [Caulobacteraceae bacterium]
MSTAPEAPMSGLTVVDFSTLVAGPWATRLMADCGAEVIKVETVGEGDLLRYAPPIVDGMSRVFAQFNRGKKSIVLDLKSPDDALTARRLIDQADVVMENFRPGVMDRFGLGFAEAARRNPRLVYCSISGFGQDGPLAGEAAYAPVVHAMTGFDMAVLAGQDDGAEPRAASVMIADVVAASYAFGAVQTALLRRERFGVGGFVDVTLIESMLSLVAIQLQEAQAPSTLRSAAFRPVRTLDGYIIAPLVNARNFLAIFSVIGRPDWASDALLARPGAIARRRRDVEDLLGAWTAERTSADCVRVLNAAGAPCGAYATASEALTHPHLAARGSFAELEDGDGAFKVLSPPFKLGGGSTAGGDFVARLGEHTDEVLAELAAGSASAAETFPLDART